jgi:disease resistance protein RPM1
LRLEASSGLAEQLVKLKKLQSVWIDNISVAYCADLFAALSKMPLLSTLLLSASDEEFCFQGLNPESAKLHRLIIRGSWADNTLNCPIFHDHGRNLKYLAISWCSLPGDPLQLLAPHVPNLTHLSLNNISCSSILNLSAGCFPKLRTLALKRMRSVNKLDISYGALPQIECLYVTTLPLLNMIPQGIESLRSLKKLWLLDLHQNFRSQWDRYGMRQMQFVPDLVI